MFHFRRFLAIFNARNKEFYRDIGTLGWTFAFPILVIFAFSHMFRLDNTKMYKGAYMGAQKPDVHLIEWIIYDNFDEALNKLKHHLIDIIVDQENKKIWINDTSFKSEVAEQLVFAITASQLAYERIVVSSHSIKYVDWLFPGLLAMNVMWLALWGVGWVIVRQRKLGILKRYKASPLTALEYLLAQMFSRLIILIVTGVILFIGSHFIYPFTTVGSYFDLFVTYILGCLALSSLGLVVAARLSSDEFASGLLNLLTFPMMFLSEIWFSLEGSADWVKYAAQFMPLWHMTDAMRRIMNEGATLSEVSYSLMILFIISCVAITIGSKTFKWTVD